MTTLQRQLVNERLSLQEAAVLLPSLTVLPSGRVRSVLDARVHWIAHGLSAEDATNRAVSLAKRMSAKRLAALKSRSTALSKTAERHDKELRRLVLSAVDAAIGSLPPASQMTPSVTGHDLDRILDAMREVLGVSSS